MEWLSEPPPRTPGVLMAVLVWVLNLAISVQASMSRIMSRKSISIVLISYLASKRATSEACLSKSTRWQFISLRPLPNLPSLFIYTIEPNVLLFLKNLMVVLLFASADTVVAWPPDGSGKMCWLWDGKLSCCWLSSGTKMRSSNWSKSWCIWSWVLAGPLGLLDSNSSKMASCVSAGRITPILVLIVESLRSSMGAKNDDEDEGPSGLFLLCLLWWYRWFLSAWSAETFSWFTLLIWASAWAWFGCWCWTCSICCSAEAFGKILKLTKRITLNRTISLFIILSAPIPLLSSFRHSSCRRRSLAFRPIDHLNCLFFRFIVALSSLFPPPLASLDSCISLASTSMLWSLNSDQLLRWFSSWSCTLKAELVLISRLTCDLHYWFLRVTWEEELEFALQVNWISAGDRLLDARILYALIFWWIISTNICTHGRAPGYDISAKLATNLMQWANVDIPVKVLNELIDILKCSYKLHYITLHQMATTATATSTATAVAVATDTTNIIQTLITLQLNLITNLKPPYISHPQIHLGAHDADENFHIISSHGTIPIGFRSNHLTGSGRKWPHLMKNNVWHWRCYIWCLMIIEMSSTMLAWQACARLG